MKLIIVESPAKCNTIQRYLGDEYVVKASLGHIRDLATSGKGGLGVDIPNGFAPAYKINKDKIKVVEELKELAKKYDEVILATDPDREGEAIAWHLANVLGLDVNTNKRLEFHEITRDSITSALANPRTIDLNLVASQETRRIVDRIIGFKLSTLIYNKIKSKSAGRVQSATLKLIDDHDKEIKAFVPEEYWNILVNVNYGTKLLDLSYAGKDGVKEVKNEKQANEIINNLPELLKVIDVKKTIKVIESKEPFTTSTMQQEAYSKLKFKTSKTQSVAQSLYEGLDINGEHVGLITYMRTDLSRLSPTYIEKATNFIIETYGKEYLGASKKVKKTNMTQGAHEAIRPTSNHRTPESVRPYLTNDQYNLYKLIYNRALSSLMANKKEEVLTVTFDGNGYKFEIEFTRTIFPGYELLSKENANRNISFPDINIGDDLVINEKKCEQKFTQPPSPYSEAKVVKLMEEVGIGRPSTYASTISTIHKRGYVTNEGGILSVTEQGSKTVHVLGKYFPDIIDVKYTAEMESRLDEIETGKSERLDVLNEFYEPFNKEVEEAKVKMYKDEEEFLDEKCPICGSPLVVKKSKNGTFIGCSNYPKCDYVKKEPKKAPVYTGETCPECGKPLVERTDKKGNKFIACSGYPKCKYILQTPVEVKEDQYVKVCPKCGGHLIKKKGKYGTFLGCTNYPTCNYMEKIKRGKRK